MRSKHIKYNTFNMELQILTVGKGPMEDVRSRTCFLTTELVMGGSSMVHSHNGKYYSVYSKPLRRIPFLSVRVVDKKIIYIYRWTGPETLFSFSFGTKRASVVIESLYLSVFISVLSFL